MILRKHRFHGHNSLRYVYSNGKTFRTTQLSIRVAPNDRRQDYRCAVVVSKKVSKSAVVRNRIRRRIYEVIRLQGVQITQPADIVVTVFTDQVASQPPAELATALKKLLKQAGVIE